jgi:hypothetical protein
MIGRNRSTQARVLMVLMLFGMMAFDFVAMNEVDAAPVQTKLTIRQRIDSNRADCKAGGGSLAVDRTFSSGPFPILTGATTTCKGGTFDGDTCTHTQTSADCQYGKTAVPQPNALVTVPVAVDQRPATHLADGFLHLMPGR